MKATLAKVEKRVTVRERKVEGIYSYDIDNNYPNRIKDIVNASSMGRTCLTLYKRFIYGNGFRDANLSRIILNRFGLTTDKLYSLICDDVANYSGYALHINYNALYQITEINHQPFAQVRMTLPDGDNANMYAIHKDWGLKNIRKSDIVYINKFNPSPDVIQREVEEAGGWQNYRGQIYYFPEGDVYPLAMYDAVLEDLQTDFQVKLFKNRNVSTNFLASHILVTDATESGNEEGYSSNRDKSQLEIQFEEFQGGDNASKMMIIEKSHPEQTFDLKKVDIQDTDELYNWTETSTRDNIRQSFLIPSVLLQMTAGKLGTADEIIDATKYYNSITEAERIIIAESLRNVTKNFEGNIFEGFDFTIEEKKSIVKEDIPTNLMNDLTANERRALIGYEPLNTGSSKTLAEQIGVGGITALLTILIDATLTTSQKINSLQVIFNLTEEQATKMLNNGTDNISTNTAV